MVRFNSVFERLLSDDMNIGHMMLDKYSTEIEYFGDQVIYSNNTILNSYDFFLSLE